LASSATQGRIIKHPANVSELYPLTPRPSRFDREHAMTLIREAEERAAALLAAAQTRAADMLRAADEERAAREEGLRASIRAEAERDVRQRLIVEMDASRERFKGLIAQAKLNDSELRATCYADLIALASAVAERVIGRELTTDPTIVERVAALALERAPLESVVSVMVHPDDYGAMERWAAEALGAHKGQIAVVVDTAVGPGGCVIGMKSGFIDARIETQLAEIRRALAEVVADA
jgi:flagellar biosynthesis/type III secretory pathway protein FliH